MDTGNPGGGQPAPADRTMKNLWKLAGIGTGVVLTMLFVGALGRVMVGQSQDRRFMDLRSQLLGGNGIGVTVRDVDQADVKREKLPADSGAVIDDVRTESPAAKAGLKAGDVIVSFDGEKVRSARHFARLLDETPQGREVEATVIRDGERVNVKVAPVASEGVNWALRRPLSGGGTMVLPQVIMPESRNLKVAPMTGRSFFFSRARLGVSAQDLTDQLGAYFGAPEGALITSVDDDSAARTAGLKAGDVVTKVNGGLVRNASDLQRRLMDASGETTLTIVRDRKEQTLKVKLEDEVMQTRIRR
jgi:serine protease Do